jgi:hypothetical protein
MNYKYCVNLCNSLNSDQQSPYIKYEQYYFHEYFIHNFFINPNLITYMLIFVFFKINEKRDL